MSALVSFVKRPFVLSVILAALAAAFFIFWGSDAAPPAPHITGAYEVDGTTVRLVDGKSVEAHPSGSSSAITTEYFGFDTKGDFDANGIEDVAFLFTQRSGRSGTFFYVVAALGVEGGYHGTNGLLLGDRIAPKMVSIENGEIVVSFAERAPGQAMTDTPSVAMTKYFSIERGRLVELARLPAFKKKTGISGVARLGPNCPVLQDPPRPDCLDRPYLTALTVTTPDGATTIKDFSTHADGRFAVDVPAGQYSIRSAAAANVLPYCAGPGIITVQEGAFTDITVSCDTGIR